MNENLEKNIENMLLIDVSNIYLFDIFSDNLNSYNYIDGKFTISKKESLTEYLEKIKNTVEKDSLSDYMNLISIPKLEEAKKSGKDRLKASYITLDGKKFEAYSMLVTIDNRKCVLVMEKDVRNINNSIATDDRFNKLIDNLSDIIVKVQNTFNLDKKSLSSIDSLGEYINSLFNSLSSSYPELKKSLTKTFANVSARSKDTILIVDDDMVMRNMIKKIFNDEYKIVMAQNGKEAIEYLDSNGNKGFSEESDHVLGIFLDLTMPVLDGFAVLEYLSKKNYLNKVPVIIISGDYEKETKKRVYNYNIADMLEKPFDFDVVRHRIGNFINLYKSSNSLNNLINNQNDNLKDLINPYIEAYRYDYSESINRIKEYIKILGNQIIIDYPEYNLDEEKLNKIEEASMYYDIGFYSVPRKILSKTKGFNDKDLDIIKGYPKFGSLMVNYVLGLISDEEYKKYCINITKYYHENYDGTGYPSGITGDNIPIESQIVAISVMYNNLLNKNYNNPNDIIIAKSGTMFNPKLVGSFMKVMEKFKQVK